MILLKKLFLILFFFLIYNNNLSAETKIAYIDMDLILSKSKAGSNLLSQLNKIEKNKIENLKKVEEQLINEKNKIMGSKNLVTKDDFNISISNFQKKLEEYKKNKIAELKKLKDQRNKEILKLFNLITPFVENYMDNNKITILFDKKKVFIAKSDYNISKFIIEIIDKNIKNTIIE